MKIKGKLETGTIILLIAFFGFIALCYVLFPYLLHRHGISIGIRLQLPYSGHGRIIRQALTLKTMDLDSRSFLAFSGDEVVLRRLINMQEGNMYLSLWRKRMLPPDEVIWQVVLVEGDEEEVIIEIPQFGLYKFHFHIISFKGKVDLHWEMH